MWQESSRKSQSNVRRKLCALIKSWTVHRILDVIDTRAHTRTTVIIKYEFVLSNFRKSVSAKKARKKGNREHYYNILATDMSHVKCNVLVAICPYYTSAGLSTEKFLFSILLPLLYTTFNNLTVQWTISEEKICILLHLYSPSYSFLNKNANKTAKGFPDQQLQIIGSRSGA